MNLEITGNVKDSIVKYIIHRRDILESHKPYCQTKTSLKALIATCQELTRIADDLERAEIK